MESNFSILDTVVLAEDANNLLRGTIGTITEILSPNTFLVEFSNNSGVAYAFLELTSNQLIKVIQEPLTV